MNRFHCCATCVNFQAAKMGREMKYSCSRLGYDTKPTYVFHCWDPKEQVRSLMNKRQEEGGH